MSWASTISGSVSTPNKSSRGGRKVNGWIIHHNAARDGRGVLEMMRTGSKQVSANYQVLENGDVWGVVPREERSWSASNAAWDGASLTFEIANNSGAPGWTISEAAYHSIARTIAEDAAWAGIPINRTTVRGHSEGSAQGAGGSYSTACPGGIDLDRLVNLANQYRAGTAGGNSVPLIDYALLRRQKEEAMFIKGTTNPDVYETFTDPNGVKRLRACSKGEAAYAIAGGVVITGDDATLTMTAIELQYRKPFTPSVSSNVDFTPAQLATIASHIQPGMTPEQVSEAVKVGMESVVGSLGFQTKS